MDGKDGAPVCVPHEGFEKSLDLLRLDLHGSPLTSRVNSGAFVALGRTLRNTVELSILPVNSGIRIEFLWRILVLRVIAAVRVLIAVFSIMIEWLCA